VLRQRVEAEYLKGLRKDVYFGPDYRKGVSVFLEKRPAGIWPDNRLTEAEAAARRARERSLSAGIDCCTKLSDGVMIGNGAAR
jgi:hypothetical protein